MATPLNKVIDVINTLKSDEVVFSSEAIPERYAEMGVVQASIDLDTDYPITTITIQIDDGDGNIIDKTIKVIDADLPQKQIYFCGIYAYRNYAMQEHDKYAKKAVNFKTINFAVSGLTERAKELMRIVWWCDNEIARLKSAFVSPMGHSSVMKGDE